MVEANIKDFTTIHSNELLYFQYPLIFDYLEGIIVIRLKTGYSFEFPFQLIFRSIKNIPPADINLFLPKGNTITEKLNRRLYANILNILLQLKRELSEIHGVDTNTLTTLFTGVYPN